MSNICLFDLLKKKIILKYAYCPLQDELYIGSADCLLFLLFFFFCLPCSVPNPSSKADEREDLMRRFYSRESCSVNGVLAHRERCQALSGSFSASLL